MSARYAIYWAPKPGDPLDLFGAAWLGRCAWTGMARGQPQIPGLPRDDFAAMTAEPRRYGLHATLKAPFRLAEGVSEADLLATVAALAGRLTAPRIRLDLAMMRGFLALVPTTTPDSLNDLATVCVTELDSCRAPLSAAEIARRQPETLSQAQRAYLQRWGYPYVFDQFSFHVTLSGWISPKTSALLTWWVQPRLRPLLAEQIELDALTVFIQPALGADFRALQRFELSGSPTGPA